MDCAEAKLQIEPYVAGEIAEDQKGALEEHLAGCAECRLDSELTRASRSTPAAPDPNAAPAAFIESIRPDDAGGEAHGGNAGGAGNAAPAGASQAADGSWTLDSIFGAGGAGAAAPAAFAEQPSPPSAPLAERAAAAAEPLPEHETALPALFDGPADAIPTDEPPASDAPTWDFEPADQKGSAKPPEGSLFFAEEALSRSGTAAKKKSAMPRILLWGAGGLVGVGLLALSIWIAMTVRQPLPTAGIAERRTIRAGAGPEAPGSQAASGAPAVPEAAPQAASGSSGAGASSSTVAAGAAPAPAATASAPAATVAAPQPTAVARSTDTTPPPAETETPAQPQAASSRQTPSATSRVATREPRAHAAAVAPPRKPPTEALTSTTHAATRSTPAPKPPPAKKPVVAASPATPDDGAGREATAPVRPAPQGTAPSPTPGSDAAPSSGGAATSAGSVAETTEPPASGPAPTPPAAASGQTADPIDRLHLATLNAEQNADLVSLRKLRDAWRGFVRTSLGPDRSRAKRELADCLWAIQTLTTKTSDQKEALVAYRDYILNAPAGGADARTVARLRQLEDAVAESR